MPTAVPILKEILKCTSSMMHQIAGSNNLLNHRSLDQRLIYRLSCRLSTPAYRRLHDPAYYCHLPTDVCLILTARLYILQDDYI